MFLHKLQITYTCVFVEYQVQVNKYGYLYHLYYLYYLYGYLYNLYFTLECCYEKLDTCCIDSLHLESVNVHTSLCECVYPLLVS